MTGRSRHLLPFPWLGDLAGFRVSSPPGRSEGSMATPRPTTPHRAVSAPTLGYLGDLPPETFPARDV